MSRLSDRFAATKEAKRSALIAFTMGGDPDLAATLALMRGLVKNGADIIEIGMPFSDPMADGPAIQAAGERALKAKTTLPGILDTVRRFRQDDATTPLILMGYINPILAYGVETFAKDASDAGADGLILVDLPFEEQPGFAETFAKNKLDLIQLISPATTGARLAKLAKAARGFVYYVSIAGITGTASASVESIKNAAAEIRKSTKLPIAAGFGIRDASQVKELNGIVEGIVVGSALVNEVARLSPGPIPTHAPVFQRCKSLADALRN